MNVEGRARAGVANASLLLQEPAPQPGTHRGIAVLLVWWVLIF